MPRDRKLADGLIGSCPLLMRFTAAIFGHVFVMMLRKAVAGCLESEPTLKVCVRNSTPLGKHSLICLTLTLPYTSLLFLSPHVRGRLFIPWILPAGIAHFGPYARWVGSSDALPHARVILQHRPPSARRAPFRTLRYAPSSQEAPTGSTPTCTQLCFSGH